MNPTTRSHPRQRASRGLPRPALSALFLAVAACGSDAGQKTQTQEEPPAEGAPGPALDGGPGKVFENPGAGPNESKRFFEDGNWGGKADEIRLIRAAWGRLVDVYGLGPDRSRSFEQRDFVIDGSLQSDGVDYLLESHPITGQAELTILRNVSDLSAGGGRDQFVDLLRNAEQDLTTIFDNGLPTGPSLWSMVPRNAAVVLHFDDLLDASLVSRETVRTAVGLPAVEPFEARVLLDTNHGDWAVLGDDTRRTFYGTRVVVDTTVSELEAATSPVPLTANHLGLPPSHDPSLSNLVLRLPTKEKPLFGQHVILRNLRGASLAIAHNGTIDFGSPTVDVVRAARSGGPSHLIGDPDNGFLPDDEPPRLVGTTPIQIQLAPVPYPKGDALDFELPLITFDAPDCAELPERGDAIDQGVFLALVTTRSATRVNERVFRVRVRLVLGDPAAWVASAVGPARYSTPYDPDTNGGAQACFVELAPLATGYPQAPTTGVDPAAEVRLRFSEPVVPTTIAPSDAVHLTRVPATAVKSGYDIVPADVLPHPIQRSLSLIPVLPLAHQAGQAEAYFLSAGGSLGDLAGNALVGELDSVRLTVEPAAASWVTHGHVTRFSAFDEEPPIGGAFGPQPEWSGQHLYDLERELIRPRPVVHFEALADRSQPVPALMIPFPMGVQTPLNPMGARDQIQWRYPDMGFDLTDPAYLNLDVEGLAWSPVAGAVIADQFSLFEIRLAHGTNLPDEVIDAASLFPRYPHSGLEKVYVQNLLDDQEIVHPRHLGYVVNPGDLYVASSGTKLMPFPTFESTYTWRDTALRERDGDQNGGVPLDQELHALGKQPPNNKFNSTGHVQSLGLPLLIEFRCFPDMGAMGLNAFDVSLASAASSRPYFRAFSAGGIDVNGNIVLVDPDLETEANGGFNPLSNPPGQKTFGLDNVYHIGSVDFVVRVSRSHSVWRVAIDPRGGALASPSYMGPLLEPGPDAQPTGTDVTVAYRGLTAFVAPPDQCTGLGNRDAFVDARTLDMYGDHYDDGCLGSGDLPDHDPGQANLGMSFLNDDDGWLGTLSAIDGATYYQVRLTFEGNRETGLVPELATFAMSWWE